MVAARLAFHTSIALASKKTLSLSGFREKAARALCFHQFLPSLKCHGGNEEADTGKSSTQYGFVCHLRNIIIYCFVFVFVFCFFSLLSVAHGIPRLGVEWEL